MSRGTINARAVAGKNTNNAMVALKYEREHFYERKVKFLTVSDLISLTGAQCAGYSTSDLSKKIYDVSTLEEARSDQISFLHSGAYVEKFLTSKAGVCLIDAKHQNQIPSTMVGLVHMNPYFAYAVVASAFFREKKMRFVSDVSQTTIGDGAEIARSAYIGNGVRIGKNCTVGPSAYIGDNCVIGDDCVIGASASVCYSIIGDRCQIYTGARVGQDGFGFAFDNGINHKITHLGLVLIGDDVEIGANSCVDRGVISDTVIESQVKIDNLNQIAHNVRIGRGTVIAGCSAIAGSATIGRFVQIGGSVNIAGHITIGDRAKIAGASGLMRDVEVGETVAGAPAMPIRSWHKLNSRLAKIASGDVS